MNLPIAFLSLGAVVVGAAGGPIATLLGLSEVPSLGIGDYLPAVLVALGGVGLAWAEYGRKGAGQTGFVARFPSLQALMLDRWKIDALYRKSAVALALAIARASLYAENTVLDRFGDLIGARALQSGESTAKVQSGRVQVYIGLAMVIVAAMVLYVGAG